MKNKEEKKAKVEGSNEAALPEYESPEITTYTEEEILKKIGPAHACSPEPCGIG